MHRKGLLGSTVMQILVAMSCKNCNRKKYDSSNATQLQNHGYESSFIINGLLQDKKFASH